MSLCNDILSEKAVKSLAADLSKGNEYICETAGFVPLEVKMRQFEQNGIIAQFQVSDFDSNDYRDIYLNPDFNIYPEDDFEDVQEKLKARNNYIAELKARNNHIAELKKMKSPDLKEQAGTQEPEKEKKVSETPENVEKLQK